MNKEFEYKIYRQREDLPTERLTEAAKIFCQIWQEEPWKEDWTIADASDALTRPFAKTDGLLILCTKDHQVAGFSAGNATAKEELAKKVEPEFIDKLSDQPIFIITQIGVDSRQRGHGLGHQLLNRLIEEVYKNNPGYQIVLHTDQRAESAKALYTKVGFVDTGLKDLRYPEHTYWIYKK